MSNSSVKITETLMLRRIDPVEMLRQYLLGEYKTLIIPNNKVVLCSNFINLNQKVGNDPNSRVYKFNDKTNYGQVIVTTNHNQYSDFRENIKSKKICLWSRREIKGEAIGIPITMEFDSHINKVTFYTEDTYADFESAMAGLKRFYYCHRNYKDPLYMDAEQMLHCMYYRMYPNKVGSRINEAKDWRLLDINGGPLTEEEYDSEQHGYIQIPNVVIIPTKRQYVKLTLPKKN